MPGCQNHTGNQTSQWHLCHWQQALPNSFSFFFPITLCADGESALEVHVPLGVPPGEANWQSQASQHGQRHLLEIPVAMRPVVGMTLPLQCFACRRTPSRIAGSLTRHPPVPSALRTDPVTGASWFQHGQELSAKTAGFPFPHHLEGSGAGLASNPHLQARA